VLKKFYIKNFALFDELQVSFDAGLNIITGETGAGKSLIIDALNTILGERADPAVVRTGAEKAIIEGVFQIPQKEELTRLLKDYDIDLIDNELIIRREILASGRSRAFINDSPVSIQMLLEIGNHLVDLHGQHEHQSLLKSDRHIDYLDEFGDLRPLVQSVHQRYKTIRELKQSLARLQERARMLQEKRDYLEFQLREITQVNPQPHEDAELEREERILGNSERLYELSSQLYQMLYEGEASVYEKLGLAENLLRELSQIDERLQEYLESCETAKICISEIANYLPTYIGSIEFNPERLESIRERLALLSRLKRKYGGTLEAVLAHKEQIEKDLELTENVDLEIEKIEKQIAEEQRIFSELSIKLSQTRKEVATRLESQVVQVLAELGMERARFHVEIRQREDPEGLVVWEGKRYWATAKGMDHVEFFIAANPGEDLKPLAKVASGGEISRIMLAIKSILAEKDRIPLLVFDEVDIGISGRIAQAVGRRLRHLAHSHQIICITHLPQIASAGNTHFSVEKRIEGNRTTTSVRRLAFADRVMEIAKLIGGEKITDINLRSAEELLRKSSEGES